MPLKCWLTNRVPNGRCSFAGISIRNIWILTIIIIIIIRPCEPRVYIIRLQEYSEKKKHKKPHFFLIRALAVVYIRKYSVRYSHGNDDYILKYLVVIFFFFFTPFSFLFHYLLRFVPVNKRAFGTGVNIRILRSPSNKNRREITTSGVYASFHIQRATYTVRTIIPVCRPQ